MGVGSCEIVVINGFVFVLFFFFFLGCVFSFFSEFFKRGSVVSGLELRLVRDLYFMLFKKCVLFFFKEAE